MNKKAIFTTLGVAVLALSSISETRAASLLLDGSFESPVQPNTGTGTPTSDGNNLGVAPDNWIVSTSATGAQTASLSNIARGTAYGTGGSLLPAFDGSQALDGVNATVVVYQDFTVSADSPLSVQIEFGGRDSNSATGAGSSWTIIDTTNTTTFATGATVQPNPGTYVSDNLVTTILTAGTYRFAITLGDPDEVDAVSITTVPEPSTLAAAGIGAALLGWVGIKRRRRN